MVIKQKLNFWIVSYSILIIETIVSTLYLKKEMQRNLKVTSSKPWSPLQRTKGKVQEHTLTLILSPVPTLPSYYRMMWPHQLSVRISKEGYQMICKIVLIISQNYWTIILWIEIKTSCDLSKIMFSIFVHTACIMKHIMTTVSESLRFSFLICKWRFHLPNRVVMIINNVFKAPNTLHDT